MRWNWVQQYTAGRQGAPRGALYYTINTWANVKDVSCPYNKHCTILSASYNFCDLTLHKENKTTVKNLIIAYLTYDISDVTIIFLSLCFSQGYTWFIILRFLSPSATLSSTTVIFSSSSSRFFKNLTNTPLVKPLELSSKASASWHLHSQMKNAVFCTLENKKMYKFSLE